MIDKKKLLKILIIILLIVIIIFAINFIRNTLARYETTATSEKDVDVAFWITDNDFKTDRLLIEDIYPNEDPFEYTFTVSNFDPGSDLESEADDKIAETDLEYEIVLTTTTNLPLSYEITRNGLTYTNTTERLYKENDTDENATIYREIKIGTTENPYPLLMDTINNDTKEKAKITDTFKIKVTFPQQYSANLEYADLMEDIKLNLSARQVISE